ncbi:dipeptide ABC transporter ATP-binding protein, partial [Burkholderia sp. SIMBA_013]
VDTATSGEILLNGQKLHSNNYPQLCNNIRMIFQDSENSLNAHLNIGKQLEEPLLFNTQLTAAERQERVNLTLQRVGMLREHWEFYPHMLS